MTCGSCYRRRELTFTEARNLSVGSEARSLKGKVTSAVKKTVNKLSKDCKSAFQGSLIVDIVVVDESTGSVASDIEEERR